jgi:hypothetical protein
MTLFAIIGVWVLHYEMPKYMREDPYITKGLLSARFENGSVIPSTTHFFTSYSNLLNLSSILSKHNNTYYMEYMIEKCELNKDYDYKILNYVVFDSVTCWIINSFLFFVMTYEFLQPKQTHKYKFFLVIWQCLCLCALMGCVLQNIQALKNTDSKQSYVNHLRYNMNGYAKTNISYYNYFEFNNQYEFYDSICGLTRYKEEIVYVKFKTFYPHNQNSYQQMDLALLICMTLASFFVNIGFLVYYCYSKDQYEEIKEEYGEL